MQLQRINEQLLEPSSRLEVCKYTFSFHLTNVLLLNRIKYFHIFKEYHAAILLFNKKKNYSALRGMPYYT